MDQDNYKLVIGKIVGKVDEQWWGQVHDYIPTGQHLVRGRLVAAISLESNHEAGQVKMVETGREILARLHEQYYGNDSPDLFANLKAAVALVNEEYQDVQIAAVVVASNIIYISCVKGAVWLSVDGKEGWVSQSEGLVTSASGFVQPGQLLIAGNTRFWKNVPAGFLKAAAGRAMTDMEEAVETLAAVEHGQTNAGGAVGVLVKVEPITASEPIYRNPETSVATISTPRSEPGIRSGNAINYKIRTGWLKNRWKSIREKLPSLKSEVFVAGGDKTAGRRKTMIVGVVCVVLLFAVVGIGSLRNKYQTKQSNETQQQIDAIVHSFNEARTLVGINNLRSRQLLLNVEQSLNDLENAGVKNDKLIQIRSELGEVSELVSGIKRVEAIEVIDLSLVRSDLKGDLIVSSGTNLYVLDISGSRLVKIDPKKKSGEVVSGQNIIGEAKLIAWYPGKIVILNNAGISELNENGQSGKQILAADDLWQSTSDMEMYGANLYILDSAAGKIWKHAGLANGLGKAGSWIEEGNTGVEGDNSLSIDGSIWTVGSGNSSIKKYTRGELETFTAEEIEPDLGGQLKIAVNEGGTKIFVMDRENGRIGIWNKTGEFVNQMVNENIKEANDFGVEEKAGTIYLVGGSKVWEIKL